MILETERGARVPILDKTVNEECLLSCVASKES